MFLFLVALLIILVYIWLKFRFSYWKRRNVPYIKPIIPFGNIKGVGSTEMIGLRFQDLYKKGKKLNHPFVGIYMFISPAALIMDLDLMKKVYIKDFQHFHDRDIYHNEKDDPLSGNLLAITGAKWTKLRSKLSPTFTSGKMKYMFPTVLKVGEKLSEILNETLSENPTGKVELQLKELFSRYSTDVIGTCAFGIECNSLKDPNAEFRSYGRKIFEEPRIGILMRLFATFFPNMCRKLHVKSERDDVTEFFMRALKETIKYREENNVKRNDFLDMMIELKNSANEDERITFNEICAQAYIFFLGGFETSSTTLGFCVYELAKNLDIQENARDEIEKVYQKHNKNWTYEALSELHYCHRIVDEIPQLENLKLFVQYLDGLILCNPDEDMKYIETSVNRTKCFICPITRKLRVDSETLRKYPPVSINLREVTKDYFDEETGIEFEKGQKIIIPVYGIHHDADYWPDPEKFDPDRFLPQNVANRPQFTYIPFGDGPRHCIGKRFGLMQTYIGLVSILREFNITQCSKTPKEIILSPKAFVLAPIEPIWLELQYNKKVTSL